MKGKNWIYLTQDTKKYQVLATMVMNFRVP